MDTTRRKFLAGGVAAGVAVWPRGGLTWGAQPEKSQYRVGSCNLDLEAAKKAGLDGIQARLKLVGDQVDASQPGVREAYKRKMQETGLPIRSLMMGFLNTCPLASDPRSRLAGAGH